MNFSFIQSPNFNSRPLDTKISSIVLHHTVIDLELTIKAFLNPLSKVSSHYVIDKNGAIIKMVQEENRAWHAGISCWNNKVNVNDYSIGIEIVNSGTEEFTVAQINSIIMLCRSLIEIYNIPACNIVGHSDIAPNRKIDPSHLFKWDILAKNEIGLYPQVRGNSKAIFNYDKAKIGFDNSIHEVQSSLLQYGYPIEVTRKLDKQTINVITAFKRHFCPYSFSLTKENYWDQDSDLRLKELLEIKKQKYSSLMNKRI